MSKKMRVNASQCFVLNVDMNMDMENGNWRVDTGCTHRKRCMTGDSVISPAESLSCAWFARAACSLQPTVYSDPYRTEG
jgi:hypothetical protein